MLKHLPEKSLKKIRKTSLFSNKTVLCNKTTIDRRTYNSTMPPDITDENLDDRITLFREQLKNKIVYRIPLRYFTNIGKVNFPLKIDFKIKCDLETDMKKLFKSKKRVSAIGVPDAKIIFTKAPFVQYELFYWKKVSDSQHTETIMISKKILHMCAQNTPLQKTYEMPVGSDSINVEFFGLNRQFDCSKFLFFTTEVINTRQYMTATMLNLPQK